MFGVCDIPLNIFFFFNLTNREKSFLLSAQIPQLQQSFWSCVFKRIAFSFVQISNKQKPAWQKSPVGWTLAPHTLPAPTRQLRQQLVSSGGEASGEGGRELRLNLGNSSQIVSSPPRDPPFPVARGQPSSHIFPQASASPQSPGQP